MRKQASDSGGGARHTHTLQGPGEEEEEGTERRKCRGAVDQLCQCGACDLEGGCVTIRPA